MTNKLNYLNSNKNIFSYLISIFGVGKYRAKLICEMLKINFFKKLKLLNESEINSIYDKLSFFKTEEALKKEIKSNILKLINKKCYKGLRHTKNLPVRGQNTKNNSRTRKGPKKTIFLKNLKNFKNVKNVKKKK